MPQPPLKDFDAEDEGDRKTTAALLRSIAVGIETGRLKLQSVFQKVELPIPDKLRRKVAHDVGPDGIEHLHIHVDYLSGYGSGSVLGPDSGITAGPSGPTVTQAGPE